MAPILMRLPPQTNPVSDRLATLYDLPELTVFEASGADATSFLQGQITNDILALGNDHACLAGYCTAQGRLLASMILMHAKSGAESSPALYGLVRRDILEPVLKRLGMFVMRAKAKLFPTQLDVRGVRLNASDREAFEKALGFELPSAPWQKAETPAGTWIAAPSVSMQRWWLISGSEHTAALAAVSQHCTTGANSDWRAQDIEAGLPWIEAATQDLFIPQTLNLDLIQGVSFTKGCYPGQEIVARSHYRGTVKRRMVLATVELDRLNEQTETTAGFNLTAGADVYDASREDQICGRMINIAQSNGRLYVLLESSFEAVDHAQLRAGSANGPALVVQSLPYPVRSEQSKD